MPWLFRTYSDTSHAFNGPTSFAPAAATTRGVNEYRAPAALVDMKEQLTVAISGRKIAPLNPFVFFTPSLLLALQFAHFRKGGFFKGVPEQNIRIVCFDSDQARTPYGAPVQFGRNENMTKKYGIETFDYGVPRCHLAEYVTMDCVVLDSTARTASFEDIIGEGLYRLYPAIQELTNNTKFAPRVNLELRKLRKFSFSEDSMIRTCGPARIDLAAKIAATFEPIGRECSNEFVATHLLAWLLSVTKRDTSGQGAIAEWLGDDAFPRPSDSMDHDAGFTMDITTMPEVQQFYEILAMMSNIAMGNQVLSATTSISAKDNQEEIFDLRDQQQVDNAQFQEERKVKQATEAVVAKEKTAVKKAKATKKKDAEAATKRKLRKKSRKKRDAEKVAREKAKTKREKDKITAKKAKAKREREKFAKDTAKLAESEACEGEAKIAAEKKMDAKNMQIEALERKMAQKWT